MHYPQPHSGGSGLNIPTNPIGWIAISVLIALSVFKVARCKRILYSSFIIWLTIGCLLLLLPLIYAPSTGWYSHQRLLGLFAGLAILIAMVQLEFNQADFDKVLKFILAAALIESIFSLIQFYVLPYQNYFNINSRRPSAIFFQANVAATFFATGLLISLFLRQRLSQSLNQNLGQNLERGLAQHHSKLYLFTLNAVPITCTIAIVLLQSRTGFLGAIIGVILLLANHKLGTQTKKNSPKPNKLNLNKLMPNAIRSTKVSPTKQWLTLVVLGITIAVSSLALLDRHTRASEVYSAPGLRSEIYRDSIELIKQQPIWGHGYGSFRRVYHQLQADKYRTNPNFKPQYKMAHPHNEVLLWVVEGGAITMIAIIIIGFAFLYAIFANRKTSLVKLALLLPLALHSMTEFPFYASVASWLTFLLITAYISQAPVKKCQITIHNRLIFHVFALVLVSVTTVQMVSLLISQKIITRVIISQNPVPLFKPSLPLVSANYEQVLTETTLKIALSTNQPLAVDLYITWARQQIEAMPIATYYQDLISAYLFRQQPSAASEMLTEAQLLFPDLDWQKPAEQIKIYHQKISHQP